MDFRVTGLCNRSMCGCETETITLSRKMAYRIYRHETNPNEIEKKQMKTLEISAIVSTSEDFVNQTRDQTMAIADQIKR